MLLRIFKTSQPLSWILITFIILIARIALFGVLYSSGNFNEHLETTTFWLDNFTTWSPWLSNILSTLIIISSGFFFNAIIQNINLFKGIHYLLFLFFGLLASFHPENLVLTPFILTIPFALLATKIILTPSKDKVNLGSVFNASFTIGFISLLYFSNLIYLILIWLSLAYLNKINWRHIVVSLIGIFIPWLFHDVIILSFGTEGNTLTQVTSNTIQGFNLTNYSPYNAIFILLLLIVFQLIKYLKMASGSIIKIRKTYLILFMFLLVGIAFNGFIQENYAQIMNFIIIPSSVVFTAFHLDLKKWWVSDLFLILFISVMVLNYLNI